jgi:hypothetical protein
MAAFVETGPVLLTALAPDRAREHLDARWKLLPDVDGVDGAACAPGSA